MRRLPFVFAALMLSAPLAPAFAQEAPLVTAADEARFVDWVAAFKAEARRAGVSQAVLDRAFAGVRLQASVIKADRRQPEFNRPIWEYLASAVSPTRIANGQTKKAANAATLAAIGARYAIDPHIPLAIWGIESNYGSNYGDYSVIAALATLAFEGRRAAWAKEQLLTALQILQAGDITPERMKGSWAGAMGHTQFIPTSFTAYAVDFTGDGRRDLWGDDPADALASAANYLSRSGWRQGEPALREVVLPRGIDLASLDEDNKKSVREWVRLGVRPAAGNSLPDLEGASIILPAGARGPAFMIFKNFWVIRRYNNATSYAMAVAHLAERIAGGEPFRGVWPEDERPLARSEVEQMQTRLTAMGFDTKGVDGKLGPATRAAVRAFQVSRGMPGDGYASQALLKAIGGQPTAPQVAVKLFDQTLVAEIQSRLAMLGYDPGPADGVAGENTLKALAAWAQATGGPAEVSEAALERLRAGR